MQPTTASRALYVVEALTASHGVLASWRTGQALCPARSGSESFAQVGSQYKYTSCACYTLHGAAMTVVADKGTQLIA